MTALRPYQRESIDAVFDYWRTEGGNPLIDLATGTGKSVVLATLMRELMAGYPLMRILCLVHVRELVRQNFEQLLRAWPNAPAGINSASLGRRDYRSAIVFASIQSVFRNPELLGRRDLVLIDEAHLVPQSGDGMYRTLIDGLRRAAPDLRVMGCTATPYRMDSGRLDKGKDRLFDRIVYSYDIAAGIGDKFLSPLISKGMASKIDVTGVAKRGGEFVPAALEQAADKAELIRAAVTEMVAYGANRRSWLCFCSGVDHAHHVRDEIRSRGISCETVTGETPKQERDQILSAFKAGRIKALTNMSVLTTGFDAPGVDLIAMLRPTLSTGLYVQMLGRGTRLAPAKDNCLVLDFAGNVMRHGPVDMLTDHGGKPARKGNPEDEEFKVTADRVAAKECPKCQSYVSLRATTCAYCGHEFPAEPKHEAKATDMPVMSGRDRDGWMPVMGVSYYVHHRRGDIAAPPTLRVTYSLGVTAINTWFCFSHPPGSMPHRKAGAWWLEAGGQLPPPVSVEDAIRRQSELKMPEALQFKRDDNGFNVVTARRYTKWQGAA